MLEEENHLIYIVVLLPTRVLPGRATWARASDGGVGGGIGERVMVGPCPGEGETT